MSGFIENMGSGIPIVPCAKAVYRNGRYVPNDPLHHKAVKYVEHAPVVYAPRDQRHTPDRTGTSVMSRRGYGEYYL